MDLSESQLKAGQIPGPNQRAEKAVKHEGDSDTYQSQLGPFE